MSDTTWVDTHGHLFLLKDPVDDVLGRADDAGVGWLMCPGIDVGTSERSEEISRRHPGKVRWSAGLHPHEASQWPSQEAAITGLASRAHAIGECGLDYYRELSPREDQRRTFAAHLALADEFGKPVIIHCRDAFRDVHEMLEQASLGERAVLHCWTGGPKWTKRFNELGVTFSFAGPLTYATAEALRLGAAQVPPDRCMVETDSPYLTPEPLRGIENEPANVVLTGSRLAEIWGLSVDEVALLTTATAERVFWHDR
jgi:TatD DNase family protein